MAYNYIAIINLWCRDHQPLFLQLYEFHKQPVPEDTDGKKKFASALMEFGVSIRQYNEAFLLRDITM